MAEKREAIRAVLCTSGGVLGAIVLAGLREIQGLEIVGIILSSRVFRPKMSFWQGAFSYFWQCGIPYTIYLWIITTVAEVIGELTPDRHLSTGAIAKKAGIPIFSTKDINSLESHHFLESLSPQLLITAYFDQKLGAALCDGATYAAVNIHPSYLPKNKGVDPVFVALLQDDDTVGVTLHRISEEFDVGAILAQKSFPRYRSQSLMLSTAQLMKEGVQLLRDSLPLLLDCSSGKAQTDQGSYFSWPTAAEVRKFYRQGNHLIRPSDFLRYRRH